MTEPVNFLRTSGPRACNFEALTSGRTQRMLQLAALQIRSNRDAGENTRQDPEGLARFLKKAVDDLNATRISLRSARDCAVPNR